MIPLNISPNSVVYIDDSGSSDSGLMVYSSVLVPLTHHAEASRALQCFRRSLADSPTIQIPVDYELHAHKFLPGRGRPSKIPEWNFSKASRRDVAQRLLSTAAAIPGLKVSAVYRRNPSNRVSGTDRAETFGGLLRVLDRVLEEAGATARLVIDGDGTDPSYAAQYAIVRPKRIGGPLAFLPAHTSDWLQLADLSAYLMYQSLVRRPAAQPLWDFHERHLPGVHGPVEV